jgi:Flp pilus assembly protein TadG
MRSEHDGERGITAVLTAILLLTLVTALALAINVGHVMTVRGELQTAADAAALAGALELAQHIDPSTGHVQPLAIDEARTAAASYPNYTDVTNVPATIGDVRVGRYDVTTSLFSPSNDPDVVNAVQVKATRAGGQAVPVFIDVLGRPTVDVGAYATAIVGDVCSVECPRLPLVLIATPPDCVLECNTPTLFHVTLSSSSTAGWTTFGLTPPVSANLLKDMIDGVCISGTNTYVGQTINLQNGVDQVVLSEIGARYDPDRGNTYNPLTIPVICTTANPVQTGKVVQLVGVRMLNFVYHGHSHTVDSFDMQLNCGTGEGPGACGNAGWNSPHPRLVLDCGVETWSKTCPQN